MTKADIVNEIAKNTGIDKATVLATLEAFMGSVKESLSKDENVYLRGFGSFIVKKEHRRLLVTFLRILLSLSQSTIFRHSNQQKHLLYQ